jgi:predicted transcriptional regulator
MSETTFTFRVDEQLKQQFASVAKERDRSSAQLLRDFMRDFIQREQDIAEHDDWFRRQVLAGLASAESGDLIPANDVEKEFVARRAATRQRLP